eukprot:1151431-Pelagomonas_calceolata.AAC.1
MCVALKAAFDLVKRQGLEVGLLPGVHTHFGAWASGMCRLNEKSVFAMVATPDVLQEDCYTATADGNLPIDG